MKVSIAMLALLSAVTLLLHADPVESAARLRAHDDASTERQVPVQVNKQSATLGWRAPVVDKAQPSDPADALKQQHERTAEFATKKDAAHDPHARNKASGAKTHSTAKSSANKSSTRTKKAEKQTKRHSNNHAKKANEQAQNSHNHADGQFKRHASKDKTPSSDKKSRDKHAPASKAALSTPQQVPNIHVGVASDDLYTAALNNDTVNRQAYSELQIGAEVRAAGAAVMTQMAESFRAESNKSLAFIGAVSGLVVGAVVIIIALVALNRQQSEFTVVDLESDLPELASGRVADVRLAEEEAVATGADTHEVAQVAAELVRGGDDDDGIEDSSISV